QGSPITRKVPFSTGISRAAKESRRTPIALAYRGNATRRKPRSVRSCSAAVWAGVSSCTIAGRSGYGRTARGGSAGDLRALVLEPLDDGTKSSDQFLARDLALAELDSHAERFVLRLIVEDKWLRAWAGGSLFPAFFAGFVAGQAAAYDALKCFG